MKMKKQHFVIIIVINSFIVLLGLWSPLASAGPAAVEKENIYPSRTQFKPEIDGVLDDEAWKTSPLDKEFISYSPHYGEKLPYRTLVWATYDSKNLYFAFLCIDPEPQKIKTSITKRDNMFNDDWVGLSLDAIGNGQAAYALFVNPNGVQGDILNSAVSGNDISPDFVWESAGKMTEQGFQVEVCLPLRSIRFKSGQEVKMGVLFWRRISRLGINGAWPEPKLGHGVFNIHTKIIYKNLKKPLKLELLPGIVHSSSRQRSNPEEWGTWDKFTEFGIGLKYGITSSITADITINPDFSQVESDAFQVEVNQRYPLFYSEKRPFFMEGVDIFNFFTLEYGFFPYAVNTRRIVNPSWGAKLTGTVGKSTFGIITAGDQLPQPVSTPENNGNSGNHSSQAFVGIVRGKYSLDKDNYIGLLYSGRELTDGYNRVLGMDIGYRLFTNHKFNVSFLHSMSGNGNSTSNQNLRDSNFNTQYSYTTRHLVIQTAFEHIGTDFRMDSAFLQRKGINNAWGLVEYNFYPSPKKLPWFKKYNPGVLYEYTHDLNTNQNDSMLMFFLELYFIKEGYLGTDFITSKENWQGQTFDLKQFSLKGHVQLTKWLFLDGRFTRGEKIYYQGDPSYKGKGYDGSLALVLQPGKNLNQELSYFYSDFSSQEKKIYQVNILYSKTSYQFNKYFFLRAVFQYNSYQKRMLSDFLASFTLIPGTVVHVGYGGLYESRKWQEGNWLIGQGHLVQIKRSLFLKASYLWRF